MEYIRKSGTTFPVLLDKDGSVSALYGLRAHPAKFLVDSQGRLIGTSVGYQEWDGDSMKSLVKMLVENGDKEEE